jgi:cytochrome c oxidase cbb3-type subunit III
MRYRYLCVLLNLASLSVRAQTPTDAPNLDHGKKLFQGHCISCHGPNGEGARGPTLAQANLPRASTDAALVRIIRSGLPGTEMPAHRMQPHELNNLTAFVRSLGKLAPETVPGNPVRGAELYKTKGACAQCHTLRGEGNLIGPDLTEIGRKRSAAFLRRAIAEPSAEVPQSFNAYRADVNMPLNFLFVRAKARDGREIAGVRVNEDTFSIQLRDLTGKIHSFFKDDLTELHKDWGQSPMPVYAAVFSADEMTDLVAFLSSLRGVESR